MSNLTGTHKCHTEREVCVIYTDALGDRACMGLAFRSALVEAAAAQAALVEIRHIIAAYHHYEETWHRQVLPLYPSIYPEAPTGGSPATSERIEQMRQCQDNVAHLIDAAKCRWQQRDAARRRGQGCGRQNPPHVP